MSMTIGSFVKLFYEADRYGTYPTDLLVNCSQFPVVVQVSGRLHRVKKVTFDQGAMVLVPADAEYKGRKS
jgi:hypothetical protein